MNISPILLLSIGATFGVLYGLIITIGWAITRVNRRRFHNLVGLNKIELYDLSSGKSLDKYVETISLSNNSFLNEKGERIDPKDHKCYIVENVSPNFPKIKKGFLIFMNPLTSKIEYAFNIPDLKNYR